MHRLTKLPGGPNLITIPVKGTKAMTLLAVFPVGSRYEDKKISGASHFVEHLMFKGTKKRPTSLDISRELDAAGADYNAFTNKDHTGYYVKIDSREKILAFDLLSDMLFNSKFDSQEMEKEKGVIVEELRMYEDNPTMAIDLLFDRVAFGDHPLGWDIGGTEKSVKAMTREKLYSYYRGHYFPGNMFLVAAGNIKEQEIKKLAKKYFSAGRLNKKSPVNNFKKFNWRAPGTLAKRVEVKTRKVDQAHVIMGFPGLKNDHPAHYAASILLNILGGGMSSRLFMEVREKRGLAYMIRTGGGGFRDSGVITVQAGLNPARLREAFQVIKKEIEKIKKEKVSAKELKEAKSNLSGRLTLAMEESSAQADWFAKQFLFAKKPETPEEAIKKLKKVTAAEVQKLARRFFDGKQMRLAVIGPFKKPEILKML